MSAETTTPQQRVRGRPFKKGRSGNPAGRPRGARNVATLLAEQLFDSQAEALVNKTVEIALTGDVAALRVCLDRLLPPRRDRPVRFELPKLESAADATRALAAITLAVAEGELTPSEGAELARTIEVFVNAVEVHEIERRLQVVEEQQAREPHR